MARIVTFTVTIPAVVVDRLVTAGFAVYGPHADDFTR